jgi:outer membrane protein TolC
MVSFRTTVALGFLAAALMTGCGPEFYTKQADRDDYTIVAEKNMKAIGEAPEFTINPPTLPALPQQKGEEGQAVREIPSETGASLEIKVPPLGIIPALPEMLQIPPQMPEEKAIALPSPVPEPSANALRLTTAGALRLAVQASRDYQAQKEAVYEVALTLTYQRYLFTPHPTWTGKANLSNLDGGNADTRLRTWDATSTMGVSQQLANGAVIAGNLGIAALKFINREVGDTVGSALNFNVTQPLWRGAGEAVVQENLIQAERNALYAVRSFARYEQTFSVDIASQYLRVLQNRDIVLNNWRNYQSLVINRERADWLAKAERLPEFQVDQARQDELRAYNNWIVTRQTYVNSLDSFKITLGIPVITEVVLDPGELGRLSAAGLQHSDAALEDATATGLQKRFDLMNVRDGVADADRKIVVAENGLAGDVDLVASIGYLSLNDNPQSARLAFNRGNYIIGMTINMPVDRLQERNALRVTQINRQVAGRQLDLTTSNVILQVREALRQLEQARESYEIQKRSVALAERRVESTQLLLQAGRAEQRDVLDAQQALVDAQNALTNAVVDHSVAGLQFQRDTGTLVVDEEGQIHGWVLTHSGR